MPGSLVEVVRRHADTLGERTALAFYHDQVLGATPRTLTYAELDLGARRVAGRLQQITKPGARVLLTHATPPEFLISMIGCMYAGVIPVPAPLPTGRQRHTRLFGMVRDADARLVLSDTANTGDIDDWLSREQLSGVRALPLDELGADDADAWRMPEVSPETVAFLQYTSGSTSTPKGVMVTQGSLLHNLDLLRREIGLGDGGLGGGWLPFYHDMGLIGILLELLFVGGTAVVMAPTAFLKRPHRWLELITEWRLTHSAAPNFAYDLCVQRVTDEQLEKLDLSEWRVAINGSEPVRAATVRAFTERFAACGLRPSALYPSYGMAEATLFVSGGGVDRAPLLREVAEDSLQANRLEPATAGRPARALVSCGRPDGFDLLIVDPQTGEVLPQRQVGEIWLRGASLAVGYWQRPDETAERFHATSADGRSGFFRTGDLGVLDDGELYVTGRIKELLIVHGRNIYPQDVERELRDVHPACARGVGAVFSTDATDGDLVAVQEIRPSGLDEEALRTIARSMKKLASERFGISLADVLLVRPGDVLRTTSGKIRRTAMRDSYLAGALQAVWHESAPHRPVSEVKTGSLP